MTTSLKVLLQSKGNLVFTTTPETSILDAVDKMRDSLISSLLVIDKDDNIAGILTDRDCLNKVLLKELSPRKTKVSDAMTTDVLTLPPETPIEECMQLMTEKRVRQCIIVDQGKLLGLISIGDVVKFLCSVHEQDIANLEKYISGSM